jgi:hypothetical protein
MSNGNWAISSPSGRPRFARFIRWACEALPSWRAATRIRSTTNSAVCADTRKILAASTCSLLPSRKPAIPRCPRKNASGGIGAHSERRERLRGGLTMGRVIGLLVVMVIVGLIYKFYFAKLQSEGAGTPTQAINVVGVQNDLLQIAQAERMYMAQHSSYGSLDELVSSGTMNISKSGRDGYTYEVETSAEGFRAIARCPSSTSPGCTNWAVDQNMEVKPAP